tara:strand:+ start:4638 stop:4853 length:216 start_codon:yes stop_codon:yes gene_type:complete
MKDRQITPDFKESIIVTREEIDDMAQELLDNTIYMLSKIVDEKYPSLELTEEEWFSHEILRELLTKIDKRL